MRRLLKEKHVLLLLLMIIVFVLLIVDMYCECKICIYVVEGIVSLFRLLI